ncbi:N-acetylmuramoyl-L-alanine amidase [Streptomyces sp. WAC01280]|uniref:N-acetylmuramoyl-L-alanine amidase n=1 Tax=Streptomyces sp. WAC01280 TaxID=2487424 RepID=UPI00163B9B2F|nr:N-acetylmuramoyl-L-alanine amidase [Streptomyces sp. WAC01280]
MAMTGPQRIPDAVFDLFFGTGQYSGSAMEVNCGVIHTTEGPTLYNYGGGASAPTVTSVPDFKNKRLVHHQHFDVDESARALVNKAGGVQTNQANAFQWELVGTCDPTTHRKWTSQGIDHIYWPEPPDWAVRDVAALMRWLHDQHGIPLSGRPEWMAYPASYGDSRVRMSFSEWTSFKGWCGHQHVPENDHGDPGALPFARILAVAKGDATPSEEDDMTPEERKLLTDTAAAVKRIEAKLAVAPWTYKQPGLADKRDMNQVVRDIDKSVKSLSAVGQTPAQIAALADKLADQLAARLAN